MAPGGRMKLGLLVTLAMLGVAAAFKTGFAGCADRTVEALQDARHPKIAACAGSWSGHVENASSSICSTGWRVCGWDDNLVLRSLSWKVATSISGCYAINAAQDEGLCKPCRGNLKADDLAAVGRDCPHQTPGEKSCISGGRIDASCCSDAHTDQACHYRPDVTTGVLCCKLAGIPPQILVSPKALTHVTTGVTFVLSCQAMGTPTPTVKWLKNGLPIQKNISRISVFESAGYLLISGAQTSDTAKYTCEVSNTAGSDTAVARVIVTDHESGCADGTTDGLHDYEDIQACAGGWSGHVKRGKSLCARGWHVCNPRHVSLLKMITWEDVTSLQGCYAYNAANILNQCTRCHRQDMAGVGAGCGRIRRTYKSCLAEGRVDVYRGRYSGGCNFQPGHTTGVLCCLRPKRNNGLMAMKPPSCSPRCANGGKCVGSNKCRCAPGYKGAWCQNAVCTGGCIPNSTCVKPGVCRCRSGFTGKKCRPRDNQCRAPCLHGGRCKQGKCKCAHMYTGPFCEFMVQRSPTELNRTER